jgi:hypothetical protein
MIDRLFTAIGLIGCPKVTMDLNAMCPEQRAWHEQFRLGREAAMRDRQNLESHTPFTK